MRAVAKNISEDLRGQRAPGRAPVEVSTSGMTGGVSMTVPGTGKVQLPPGEEHPRSVRKYAEVQRRYGGS
jgi:hypothetical protein